ncbi:MAG: OmpA family protein [Panacagrimonas sp.]
MKSMSCKPALAALLMICAALPATLSAQEEAASETTATPAASALNQGPYLSLMGTGLLVDDDSDLDDSFGGTLALGYRKDWWAMEIAPSSVDLDGVKLSTLALNALVFPLSSLPNFYLTAGLSGSDYDDYETPTDEIDFNTVNGDGGLGYFFPLSVGRYDFAIRSEARYRVSSREEDYNDADEDFDAPKRFKHTVINIGLHFPLGLRPLPPPPPPPVEVVAPAAICSDTLDNDGDGLIDFPGDPGCSAADDGDETDPPQCSDGKDNDGDGLIDFPSDKGCAAADDNDEVDPCKTPAPGERISLKGCGLGDIIVLRGVNFEFDKARLTTNAKTILDNVGEELTAYPEIEVELSGHTDSKGSDEYNQNLSERRAASVKTYLVGKDITKERMTTAGYGEAQPVADNETDEGRELNRRVELKVTKGVAPGGPAVVTKTAGEEAVVADPSESKPEDAVPAADAPAAAEAVPADAPAAEAAPSDPFANATP